MALENMRDKLSRFTSEYVTKHIPASIRLTVPGLGEVTCADVLHVVPLKRITCTGEAHGMHLIVKIFHARHGARRHWRRSYLGCRYFVEKDILAPAILYSGYLPQHGIYVLIFEYIEGGTGLKACVRTPGNLSREMPCLILSWLLSHNNTMEVSSSMTFTWATLWQWKGEYIPGR